MSGVHGGGAPGACDRAAAGRPGAAQDGAEQAAGHRAQQVAGETPDRKYAGGGPLTGSFVHLVNVSHIYDGHLIFSLRILQCSTTVQTSTDNYGGSVKPSVYN